MEVSDVVATLHISKKSATFPVPVAFVDNYMCDADATYVKIYLYALRHSFKNDGTALSISVIAAAVGVSEAEVVEAFAYWDAQAVVSFQHEGERFSLEFLDLDAKAAKPVQHKVIAASQPRYTIDDVNRAMRDDGKMKSMFRLAEQILGKPLNNNDLKILYSFHDWLHLPCEVVLLLIEHCMSMGKRDLRYIEKVACTWAERGITTIEAADAYVRRKAAENADEVRIKRLLQISGRELTEAERQFIHSWLDSYKVDDAAIKEAYERTVLNTGKVSFPYMDAILKNAGMPQKRPVANQPAGKRNSFQNYPQEYELSEFERAMMKKRISRDVD